MSVVPVLENVGWKRLASAEEGKPNRFKMKQQSDRYLAHIHALVICTYALYKPQDGDYLGEVVCTMSVGV